MKARKQIEGLPSLRRTCYSSPRVPIENAGFASHPLGYKQLMPRGIPHGTVELNGYLELVTRSWLKKSGT